MLKSFSLFGWLDIYLLPILLLLAAFWGTFVFYVLLHRRAAYKEFEVFDCFLLALLGGFITGRATFVGLNWSNFDGDIWRIINFLSYPGIAVFVAIFSCSFFFWLLLKRRKIHDLELLDYWARATCLGLVFYHLGLFFDGSGAGYLTEGAWGWQFPGLSAKVHPTQLYNVVFYLGLFIYLAHLEKNYRTYSWYRRTRASGKTGFILVTFLSAFSLFSLLLLCFQPPLFTWGQFSLDWIFNLLVLVVALIILYYNTFVGLRKNK